MLAFVGVWLLFAAVVLYVDGHLPARIPQGDAPLDYRPLAVALQHVSPTGVVDYLGLREDRASLDQFVAQLARVAPLNRPDLFATSEDRLAFWLNAYHALVLEAALDEAPEARLDALGRSFFWLRSWP